MSSFIKSYNLKGGCFLSIERVTLKAYESVQRKDSIIIRIMIIHQIYIVLVRTISTILFVKIANLFKVKIFKILFVILIPKP